MILVIKNCSYEISTFNKCEIKLVMIDKRVTNMNKNVSNYKNEMAYI